MQIVHLGIRKTGTSTFQRALARAEEAGVDFLYGKKILKDWINANPINNGDNPIDYRSLENILKEGRGRHAIFTHEGLIMYDPKKLSAVIKAALPDAKILVTFREPNSFLMSQYKHHVLNGGIEAPEVFSARYCRKVLFKLLNVSRVMNAFANAGLKDQLTLLPYEWQRDDYTAYLKFMSEYCALDLAKYHPGYVVNKSPGPQFNELLRRLNTALQSVDPKLLKNAEYSRFIRIASMSSAQAPELKYIFDAYYDQLEIEYELPVVPEKFRAKFSERMNPLRDIDAFKPYLAEYGLATEQKDSY